MEILLAVALLAALLLPAQLIGSAPSAPDWVPDKLRLLTRFDEADGPDAAAGDGEAAPDWSLFSRSLIHSRLDALADELDRLENDRRVFARAFNTSVARAAYDALVAEAASLPAEPCWQVGSTVEVELLAP